MYPPCLLFIENLFSELRIRVAHKLKASGFTQADIAHQLHVSQAMVSKYVSKTQTPSELLEETASEIARMIIQKKDEREILLYLCQTCFKWRESGIICAQHNMSTCTVCTQLRSPLIMDEKQRIIQTIKEALCILESTPAVVTLMPEVRMNIAMATQTALNPMEVAAFPGRLVPVHGKVTAVSDPEFGASHHLASILLETKNKAVINIKYTDNMVSLFEKAGLSVTFTADEGADVLIDEGGFGIEPSAYIFGKDAVTAAFTVQKIAELL